MKKHRKMTIVDIADMLNVSKSTVSRAFRDSYDINPETKKRILDLASQLDYEPNPIAKSLKEKKTKMIGILIPSFSIPFYAAAICSIQEVVNRNGYNLLVCQSGESYAREVKAIQTLVSSKVDGIIMSVSSETVRYDHIRRLMEKEIPIVLFNRTTSLHVSKVRVDDYGGAYRMTEYLLSRGYKNIYYISGPTNLTMVKQRLSGFKDAMYVNTRQEVTPDRIVPSTFTIQSGMEAVSGILKREVKPDAIFCVCDNVAFGVIQYLKEHNYRIPEDVAVAGYTDEPVASLIDPPLTTVRQPIEEIGVRAAELLFKQLKYSNYKHQIITMPVEVIVRKST